MDTKLKPDRSDDVTLPKTSLALQAERYKQLDGPTWNCDCTFLLPFHPALNNPNFLIFIVTCVPVIRKYKQDECTHLHAVRVLPGFSLKEARHANHALFVTTRGCKHDETCGNVQYRQWTAFPTPDVNTCKLLL
jgi:hypothetical protein